MPMIMIERSIKIHATPLMVWRAFTDPIYTKANFGGEIVSEWTVGSRYDWKTLDGKLRTHGMILTVEPGKILQYNLYRPEDKKVNHEPAVFSVITYVLAEDGEYTTLTAREEFTSMITEQEHSLAGAGWYEALATIKKLAET